MDKFIDAQALQKAADLVLDLAKQQGASAAEVTVDRSVGQSIGVRASEVETIESLRDQSVSVNVYRGEQKGNASCADLSEAALRKTVEMAYAIASHTQGDPDFGLAEASLMASTHQDLQLDYPWQVDSEELIDRALRCEAAALAADSKITNTEGASMDTSREVHVYANSHGFNDYSVNTRYDLSCAVVAEADGIMQRDYDYSTARAADRLHAVEAVGRRAAEKTVAKLGGQSITTGQYPVILDASVAGSLFGHFLQGIKGMALYHKTTFLLDSLGKQLFPDYVQLSENPLLPGGLSSAAFDAEGVQTKPKIIVGDGVLQTYLLGSYSARKLKLETTANAGGVFNLQVNPTAQGQQALLDMMGTGVLITEFMGSGINMVTGDYSRGAGGFWVQDGEIQYPIEEMTVAGNLAEMFQSIVAIGDDVDIRRATQTGSVLLDKMVISGA